MSKPHRTLADVERSGRWFSAPNNPWGLPRHVFDSWHANGCPYVRGRSLRVRHVRALVPRDKMGDAPMLVRLFNKKQCQPVAELFMAGNPAPYRKVDLHKADGVRRRAVRHATKQEITLEGKKYYSAAKSCTFLSISQPLLSVWTIHYCPYKDERKCLLYIWVDVFGKSERYYPLVELKKVKEGMDWLALGPGEMDVDAAVKRTRISSLWFRLEARAKQLGLTKLDRRQKDPKGRGARCAAFREHEIEVVRTVLLENAGECKRIHGAVAISPTMAKLIRKALVRDAVGHAAPGGAAPIAGVEADQAKRNLGGRPTDPEVATRKRLMLEGWDRGDFQGNRAAAGRAHGFNRPDASKSIKAHEAEKRRKTPTAKTPVNPI